MCSRNWNGLIHRFLFRFLRLVLRSRMCILVHWPLIPATLRLILHVLVLESLVLLLQFVFCLLLRMLVMVMFQNRSRRIKSSVAHGVFNTMSHNFSSNHIRTGTRQSQCQPSKCSSNCHRSKHIALSRLVCSSPSLEASLNDLPLLSRIVDTWARQAEADQRNSPCQWREEYGGCC